MSTESKFISVSRAAELLGMTPGRIRQLLISGDIKGLKLHQRAWLIDQKTIEKYGKKPRSSTGRPRIGKK